MSTAHNMVMLNTAMDGFNEEFNEDSDSFVVYDKSWCLNHGEYVCICGKCPNDLYPREIYDKKEKKVSIRWYAHEGSSPGYSTTSSPRYSLLMGDVIVSEENYEEFPEELLEEEFPEDGFEESVFKFEH